MTEDNNKTQSGPDKATQSEAPKSTDPSASHPKKTRNRRGSPLKRAFWYLVLVIIIATVAWLVMEKPYKNFNFNLLGDSTSGSPERQVSPPPPSFDAEAEVAQLRARISELQQSLHGIENAMAASSEAEDTKRLEQQINQLVIALRQQQQQLNELSLQLPQKQLEKMQEWRLFEAKQTVSAAARLLWGAEDYKAALSLLKIADTQLAGLESANAIQIRQLLASDIARVESAVATRSNDVALRLAGLQQRISDLPHRMDENTLAAPSNSNTTNSTSTDWRTNLSNNWDQFLTTFIRIQPTNNNAEPLLTQSQRQAMSTRLDLLLTMAQHAALKEDDTLWRTYVEQSIALVKALKGEGEAVDDVIARLQDLLLHESSLQVVRQLESLDALAQAVDQGGLQ